MNETLCYPVCCLVCRHFSLDTGSPGYSEMTPGSPASIDCDMSTKKGCAWPGRHDYPDVSPTALRSVAEKCKLFELHPDLATVQS
jgi:hypothetical protein